MATLQKFKFLATQCAVAGSPSRSPTTSPVFQLRRRKTLRMLFSRSGGGRQLTTCREESTDLQRIVGGDPPEKSKGLVSNKLKDLFISSPSPPPLNDNGKLTENVRNNGQDLIHRAAVARRGVAGIPRPLLSTFRYRLIRRSWRPVLVTIAE
ncbi:hypothetical protein BVC80_7639g2 [Macleaya cordata]|uniref:Uncharacterized protein n=1 Tax=Macleaya cordata TaxID=56857 RepID=A0A200QPF1_MACCD|nr:hypothetical protein BVC80_7639g2 [Macleaya cordata]